MFCKIASDTCLQFQYHCQSELSCLGCLKNILKCRSNGYSLRWRYLLTVFRFQTRYVKDSLKYRGAVFWNTVCCYEQEVGRSSLNNLKKKIITYSSETTLRNSFFYILSASTARLYIPIILLLRSHNICHFLLSNSSYIHTTFVPIIFFT